MKTFEPKDPDEVLDYPVDWTRHLYSSAESAAYEAAVIADPSKDLPTPPSTVVMPVDAIKASRFTVPTGLTVPSGKPSTFTDISTLIWLDKGSTEGGYVISIEVDTVLGRTLDQSFKLKVKSK